MINYKIATFRKQSSVLNSPFLYHPAEFNCSLFTIQNKHQMEVSVCCHQSNQEVQYLKTSVMNLTEYLYSQNLPGLGVYELWYYSTFIVLRKYDKWW